MNREIITIGFSDEINSIFRKYLSLDGSRLSSLADPNDIIQRPPRSDPCLMIINSAANTSDSVQEVVSRIRRNTYAPMLVITSAVSAGPILEAGADVCLPLTTDIHILFAQAMALIRRNELYSRDDISAINVAAIYRGDLTIDPLRHQVMRGEKEINLLPREFRLLSYMAKNAGIALTSEQLGHAIWLDDDHTATDVSKVISELRHHLEDNKDEPKYIETIHGYG